MCWATGALLLFLARPTAAQVQAGDVSMNLTGTLDGGYAATYGNEIGSSHSMNFGGAASLGGYFYNPNFLSFNLSPYLNQSRANSNYRSISNATGLNFNSGIFSGSRFPGAIDYATAYNSEGSFAIPGLPSFTTHGQSDTFGISWSELVPNMPSLTFGFQKGSTHYSVYGQNGEGSSAFDSFTLHSGYSTHGFNLGAQYQNGASHSLIPQLFTHSTEPVTTHSNSDGFGFNMSHLLPMRGGLSASFTRSSFQNEDQGYHFHGTVDAIAANASVQPTEKLHVSLGLNYSDNLGGTLYQAAITSGGIVLPLDTSQKSNARDILGTASYAFSPSLQAQGQVERRDQSFLGKTFGATSFDGSLLYTHAVLGGSLSASTTMADTRIDRTSQNTLGLMSTVNYSRRIERWYVGGSFGYAQNVQTLLVTYTTASYNYSANVRRRFRLVSWSASAAGSRTALTAQRDTGSASHSYSTGLGFGHWASISGSYAVSDGRGLATGAGLVPVPVPSPVLPPSLLFLYGGKSFSVGLGTTPVRRLTIGASFSKANSDTSGSALASWNRNDQLSAYFQYQFRKVSLTGGYARLSQGFSASTAPPANVSSYYLGVSRWFNFF